MMRSDPTRQLADPHAEASGPSIVRSFDRFISRSIGDADDDDDDDAAHELEELL